MGGGGYCVGRGIGGGVWGRGWAGRAAGSGYLVLVWVVLVLGDSSGLAGGGVLRLC